MAAWVLLFFAPLQISSVSLTVFNALAPNSTSREGILNEKGILYAGIYGDSGTCCNASILNGPYQSGTHAYVTVPAPYSDNPKLLLTALNKTIPGTDKLYSSDFIADFSLGSPDGLCEYSGNLCNNEHFNMVYAWSTTSDYTVRYTPADSCVVASCPPACCLKLGKVARMLFVSMMGDMATWNVTFPSPDPRPGKVETWAVPTPIWDDYSPGVYTFYISLGGIEPLCQRCTYKVGYDANNTVSYVFIYPNGPRGSKTLQHHEVITVGPGVNITCESSPTFCLPATASPTPMGTALYAQMTFKSLSPDVAYWSLNITSLRACLASFLASASHRTPLAYEPDERIVLDFDPAPFNYSSMPTSSVIAFFASDTVKMKVRTPYPNDATRLVETPESDLTTVLGIQNAVIALTAYYQGTYAPTTNSPTTSSPITRAPTVIGNVASELTFALKYSNLNQQYKMLICDGIAAFVGNSTYPISGNQVVARYTEDSNGNAVTIAQTPLKYGYAKMQSASLQTLSNTIGFTVIKVETVSVTKSPIAQPTPTPTLPSAMTSSPTVTPSQSGSLVIGVVLGAVILVTLPICYWCKSCYWYYHKQMIIRYPYRLSEFM
eukprot:jgi/Bigna1/66557/fgenesh1_pg.1_\